MSTSTRRTLAAWAAAAVLGTGAAAGAVVSTAGAASAAGTSPAATSPTAATAHRPWGALRHAGIHGEFTVKDRAGAFVVLDTQRGTVTANRNGQLTVRSADGFLATYTVDSTTRIRKDGATAALTDVKVGDTVRVVGVRRGATVTARGIRDGVAERLENPPRGTA